MTLTEFFPALMKGKGWRPPFLALRDVNFSVARGETLGIIGRNGSGKSTTLRLIAGITAPSSGDVFIRGRVSPLIELGAGFHPDLTGRENVYLNASILGMTNREIRGRFGEIVDFAGMWPFIDTAVKHYSSGMYMRLGFSVAVHSIPDILLVDEGLAVGDAEFQEKCSERMRRFQDAGVTIIVVTHSMGLAEEFCDRLILLDAGAVVAEGEPDEVVPRYTGVSRAVEEGVSALAPGA